MTIPECTAALRQHHERLKEAKEYDAKLAALREIALHTATYLSLAYEEESLRDYRTIEKMARKSLRLVEEDMSVPRRYLEHGQSWRATIALNSIGLDFFIVQSAVERVFAESGKYTGELADDASGHPLLAGMKRAFKPLLGHDRRHPEFSIRETTDAIRRGVSPTE
jgi:hypothetical protein